MAKIKNYFGRIRIIKISFILLSAFLFSQNLFSQDPPVKAVDINALVNMMEGSFSSEEQSRNNASYFDIRVHIKKMWLDNPDGKWLYVEGSPADFPEKPYRQRVYRVTQNDNNSFEIDIFTFNEPLRFTGEWQKENPLSELTFDSLIACYGCSIYLTLINDSTFQGSTIGNNCKGENEAAKYSTSEVTITKNEIISLHKEFDEAGNQIRGSDEVYIFKRIE